MSSAADFRALSEELRLDSQNPWPGLTAFTEKQHEFFYGREQESHELFSCVKRERLTVLFGKSGLGKTSLLQAGLFPRLRDAAYLPVYVRLSYEDSAAPFDAQLRSALQSAIELANFAEIALPQEGESVWEYLHRRGGNLINDDGNVVMPVLIFDQFEECFTLGARKDFSSRLVSEFLPGLGEMIENRPPAALTKKLTDDRDLAKRYDLEAHGCRILITLREDYLANLEALRDSMPSLVYIDNRMRLTEMTGEQALSVVVDPSPDLVAPDVAESIVRFVAGAHTDSADGAVKTVDSLSLKQLEVAPAILSLFCSQLNEERLRTPGMTKITRGLVLSQGVTIIEDFYKKCIVDMHPAVRRLIEDRLLTSAGYRDNIDLAEARSTLEHAGAQASYIDDLVRLRLLQIEDHRGVPRLELTHDVLAEPVKHSRDDWKKEQQHEAAQQQEREALLRAKEAEQEALKRTHFLQRMVAAAAFVCLLLATVVVWGYFEQHKATLLAEKAKRNGAALEESNRSLEASNANVRKMNQSFHEETIAAQHAAGIAEEEKNEADQSKNRANAALQALNVKKGELSGLNGRILNHCIDIHTDFDTAADGEKDAAGRDAVRALYEQFLMDNGQCLDLAKDAYKADPTNIDVSDPLAMIPVRAAISAAQHNADPPALRKQVGKYFDTALTLPMFTDKTKGDATQMELASVYLSFAYIFGYLHDDAAPAIANKGLAILADVRTRENSGNWDFRVWDLFAEANAWVSTYTYQKTGRKSDTIAPLVESFNAESRAAALAPKDKHYYANETLTRALNVADAERDLTTDDDAAIQWYKNALSIATQQKNKPTITVIYTNLRIILDRNKKYDQAVSLLDSRIKALQSDPKNTQEQKDLAQAYRDLAEVDESRKHWVQGVADRRRVLETVAAIKSDSYTGQEWQLVDDHTFLSWDEIYAGQIEQGIKDTQIAISLSENTEGHPDLASSYANGVNALNNNKQYDEALKIAEQRIHSLLATPKTTQRERDLVAIYKLAANVEETSLQWSKAANYLERVVAILSALNPDDYYGQRNDLITAHSLLSWAEIYAGDVQKGLDETQRAIALSNQTTGHPGLSDSYDDGIKALTNNKHYDEAQTLAQQRIDAVSKTPKNLQQQRDLAAAYRSAADVEEARKQWPQDAAFRAHNLDILLALKPSDYPDQRSDLVYAYSNLSWSEIFSGQLEKGIADTQKAIDLSIQTDGHPGLNDAYGNGINALRENEKYEEAERLLDAFTKALMAGPDSPLRQRQLATVVDVNRAQIAEARKQWAIAASYRADAVGKLSALGSDSYDNWKADLVSAYGSLSFESEEAGQFEQGVTAAKAGLALDPSQSWIVENEANGLLLSGKPEEAKALYMTVKDVEWDGAPMLKAISDDLHEFCTLGYTRPEMSSIAHDLGITTPELYSCLAGAAIGKKAQ